MTSAVFTFIFISIFETQRIELVLFDKFNDLRGFGRRLFLSMDQLLSSGTTKLEIEVLLGRRSPAFSLRLLRKMTQIAKEADKRMREVCLVVVNQLFYYIL